MSANEKQVGGNHYKTEFQHWDLLVAIGYGPEYFIGQATKYLTRWRKKHGIADIRKGQHFVEKLIEIVSERGDRFLYQCGLDPRSADKADLVLQRFTLLNVLSDAEAAIVSGLVFADDLEDLQAVNQLINALAEQALATGEAAAKMQAFQPTATEFEFVKYSENYDDITWRRKSTGEEMTLPSNMPPK